MCPSSETPNTQLQKHMNAVPVLCSIKDMCCPMQSLVQTVVRPIQVTALHVEDTFLCHLYLKISGQTAHFFPLKGYIYKAA